MPKLKLQDDQHCFACGSNNPAGLKLQFTLEDDCLKTTFVPDKIYQGYTNVVHGGIIGLVLDEVMVNLLWKTGKPAVTAELKLNLKIPAKVGQSIQFIGKLVKETPRIIYTSAQARDNQGNLIAEATAKCARIEI